MPYKALFCDYTIFVPEISHAKEMRRNWVRDKKSNVSVCNQRWDCIEM